MNKKGILSVLLSAAMVSASISTAAVYAEEVRFELPECLIQSLNKDNNYKTGTYITNDYVNYRQGYSTAFETYGIIPKGTKVEVTEIFNGWGKINYNGKTAWFKLEYGDYVAPVTTTTTTTTAVTTTSLSERLGIYVTNGDVYYRKGHSNNDAAYGVIPKGTKVEILEIYQGWGRTNYDGKDSWFYLKFADFLTDAKVTVPATTSTTSTTSTTTTATTTTTTKPVTTTTPVLLPLDLNFSEGDIDANGVVDASDASTVLAYYAQIQTGGVSCFNAKQILFADINNDKVIDASDASLILFYYSYASTTKDFISMKEMMACNFNPPAVTTPQTTTTTSDTVTTTTNSSTTTGEATTTSTTTTGEATTTSTTATGEETTTSTTTTSEETTTSTTTTSETTTTTTTTTTPPVTTTTYKYPLAAKTLDSVGWTLENAFKAASSITYYGQKSDMPQDDKTSMEWYAEYGFKNGKGNCYVMAAMFCEMAKTLGYDAHMISGKVPLRAGGYGPHSWVEIEENGKIYVYDPDFANETKKNGFKIEYGQSGTWKYTVEKRMN